MKPVVTANVSPCKQDTQFRPNASTQLSTVQCLWSDTVKVCCTKFTHLGTSVSYESDTHASTHLYEAELSPAESIADRGERCYSQQDIHTKSQNPRSI